MNVATDFLANCNVMLSLQFVTITGASVAFTVNYFMKHKNAETDKSEANSTVSTPKKPLAHRLSAYLFFNTLPLLLLFIMLGFSFACGIYFRMGSVSGSGTTSAIAIIV